jgi:hypothetical protein
MPVAETMTGAGLVGAVVGCTTAPGVGPPEAVVVPPEPPIPDAYPSRTTTMPTSAAATISSRRSAGRRGRAADGGLEFSWGTVPPE